MIGPETRKDGLGGGGGEYHLPATIFATAEILNGIFSSVGAGCQPRCQRSPHSRSLAAAKQARLRNVLELTCTGCLTSATVADLNKLE